MLQILELPNRQLWQGRIDSETDPTSFRFHQVVSTEEVTEKQKAFSLIGFKCEEGVRRNKGRLGAAHAPDAIRKALASLPYPFTEQTLVDAGNVICEGHQLEEAQQQLGDQVEQLLKLSTTPIILGGGHETLYGHYQGLRQHVGPEPKIGLINIDAHFDMRDSDVPTSGTMFRQILESDAQAGYLVLGIQPFGNTTSLFNKAKEWNAHYILAEDLSTEDATQLVIDDFCMKHDYILLTLCMDSIAASAAPGVSAPAPLGLDPTLVRFLIRYITNKDVTRSFDISEVNPLLDENEKTVKLAAYLVAEAMRGFATK